MNEGIVRINELRLRVPGLSVDEGRVLGEEVARTLSDHWPEGIRSRELGVLNLKVEIPAGTRRGDIARIVGEHILGALK